ncbi:hypothetical protein NE865_05510 [Phthorimaea operculella]|nr:hypothetical protein NE865_05510 [Phthorimaea operculella]
MEDECEIEYLDEDEEIVQQCVQAVPAIVESIQSGSHLQNLESLADHDVEEQIEPLLIERRKTDYKRKRNDDSDSDYNPNEDLEELEMEHKKRKLSRKAPPKSHPVRVKQSAQTQNQLTSNKQNLVRTYENKLKNLPNLTVQKKMVSVIPEQKSKRVVKNQLNDRRKLNIMIPDYEDALCLPVRAIKGTAYDSKILKTWNNLCLEHYERADKVLKPYRGEAVKSTRTITLRNIKNKNTGKLDTSIFGRTTVENSWGEKKVETFQGTLPKYREKKLVLNNYPLQISSQKHFKHTYEALLTKEEDKDGEQLVVYKPRENISAVYKLSEEKKKTQSQEEELREELRVLKEITCCKVCSSCYQVSWRGIKKQDKKDSLQCTICSRTFVSVYNLLTHLNTNHTAKDVGKHKARLSKILATMVEYHYRCRICQDRFNSIKLLRKHVSKHRGVEVFRCEIGNHMAS